MPRSITPFLAFRGQGRAALDLYTAVFEGAEILSLQAFGPGEDSVAGTLRQALLRIAGQDIRVMDVPHADGFDVTSAMSLFVLCDTGEEVARAARDLSRDGAVMTPLDRHDFADRFGVNWQLAHNPTGG